MQEVLERPDEAVASFVRALHCSAAVDLSAARHKRSAIRLFSLARGLVNSGTDVARLRSELGIDSGRDGELCGHAGARAPAAPAAAVAAPAGRATWPMWLGGSVAVVAAGTGAVLGILASSKDRACRTATDSADYAGCDSAAASLETGANIGFIAAGAAAAVTLGLFIFGDDDVAAVSVGPSGAALRVRF